MHVIAEVTSYFAASGSDSLKASISSLLDSNHVTLGSAISRKLWTVLQSQTRVPRDPELKNRTTDGFADLDFGDWADLGDEWHEPLPETTPDCLSDIDIDDADFDDTSLELSPVTSQDTPFSSQHSCPYDSFAPDADIGFETSTPQDAEELNVDIDLDDEFSGVNESFLAYSQSRLFEDMVAHDPWSQSERMAIQGENLADSFSDDEMYGGIMDDLDD